MYGGSVLVPHRLLEENFGRWQILIPRTFAVNTSLKLL